MKRSEYKRRYDPKLGKHVYENIYGEGMFDSMKDFGRRMIGKMTGRAVRKAAEKAAKDLAMKKASDLAEKKVKALFKPKGSSGNDGTRTEHKRGEDIIKILSEGDVTEPVAVTPEKIREVMREVIRDEVEGNQGRLTGGKPKDGVKELSSHEISQRVNRLLGSGTKRRRYPMIGDYVV